MPNQLPNITIPRNRSGPKGIPIEAILAYKAQGLTKKEIAERLGINPSTVTIRLRPYHQTLENTDNFKNYRATILAYWQQRILQSITPRDLEKANLRDKVISASILYDKERLESGKSTSNIAYIDMIKAKQQHEDRLNDLEREILSLGGSVDKSESEVVDKSDNSISL